MARCHMGRGEQTFVSLSLCHQKRASVMLVMLSAAHDDCGNCIQYL